MTGGHPCDRDCTVPGLQQMTCSFTLTAEEKFTDHPDRQADGQMRNIFTYNGKLPGPLLVVCEDDIVEVTLVNKLIIDPNNEKTPKSTSIHFHGIRKAVKKNMEMINKLSFLSSFPILPTAGKGMWE